MSTIFELFYCYCLFHKGMKFGYFCFFVTIYWIFFALDYMIIACLKRYFFITNLRKRERKICIWWVMRPHRNRGLISGHSYPTVQKEQKKIFLKLWTETNKLARPVFLNLLCLAACTLTGLFLYLAAPPWC